MVTTPHDNNRVATQHGRRTKHGRNIGHRQQHKDMKVETTIHHTKQAHLSVREPMIESLNEEIEIKTVQFECLFQLVPVASCSELKRGATQRTLGTNNRMTDRTGVVCRG